MKIRNIDTSGLELLDARDAFKFLDTFLMRHGGHDSVSTGAFKVVHTPENPLMIKVQILVSVVEYPFEVSRKYYIYEIYRSKTFAVSNGVDYKELSFTEYQMHNTEFRSYMLNARFEWKDKMYSLLSEKFMEQTKFDPVARSVFESLSRGINPGSVIESLYELMISRRNSEDIILPAPVTHRLYDLVQGIPKTPTRDTNEYNETGRS